MSNEELQKVKQLLEITDLINCFSFMPKYKHGKIQKTITKEILSQLLKRFEVVDRHGYSLELLQSLLAILYWSGFRISKIIGALALTC